MEKYKLSEDATHIFAHINLLTQLHMIRYWYKRKGYAIYDQSTKMRKQRKARLLAFNKQLIGIDKCRKQESHTCSIDDIFGTMSSANKIWTKWSNKHAQFMSVEAQCLFLVIFHQSTIILRYVHDQWGEVGESLGRMKMMLYCANSNQLEPWKQTMQHRQITLQSLNPPPPLPEVGRQEI